MWSDAGYPDTTPPVRRNESRMSFRTLVNLQLKVLHHPRPLLYKTPSGRSDPHSVFRQLVEDRSSESLRPFQT